MSPYWSQERLFGHWGPTNRVVFRILIIVVVAAITVMGWSLWQYGRYTSKVNTYIHEARTARETSQQQQQKQIEANALATRDLACFTVTYAEKISPKARKDPFIQGLSSRYDCNHYKVPPHVPRLPVIISKSPPGHSVSPSPPSSSRRTPGVVKSPSSQPRPRPSHTKPRPTPTPTSTTPSPPFLPLPTSICLPTLPPLPPVPCL